MNRFNIFDLEEIFIKNNLIAQQNNLAAKANLNIPSGFGDNKPNQNNNPKTYTFSNVNFFLILLACFFLGIIFIKLISK